MKQNTKNILVSVLVIVVLFGGLIWFSRRGPSTGSEQVNSGLSGGILSSEESAFNFGEVSMANGKVSHVFKIKNNSSQPAVISKIYTSCMCTEASLIIGRERMGPYGMPGHGFIPSIDKTVNPGEEVDVEAVFDPAAHGPAGVGRIDRAVFVESKSGAPLQLTFSATVTP